MKNIYILKGWFNMEEIKNGVISEEALDEIAGGLKISKSTVKKALTTAGVVIGTLGAIGGTTLAGYEIYKHNKNKKKAPLAIEWKKEDVEAKKENRQN